MKEIYNKIQSEQSLELDDVIKMLEVEVLSEEYYKLIQFANAYARRTFNNQGVIFAQIGVDAAPCSINCKFCMLAADHFKEKNRSHLELESVKHRAKSLVKANASEVFIMSTAEYEPDMFLRIGQEVRKCIGDDVRMVANTGDFDLSYAQKLVAAGFSGVYHICRLQEGVDTQASVEERLQTLDAIQEAGLELYYCVEPIGPEHTNEQIAEEILRAKNRNVNVMAVMRRVNFEESPMVHLGEISAVRMALICAVSVLCVRPKRAMGVHEPEIVSLLAGANQLYAESGNNPRDVFENTEEHRGFSVFDAKKMLKEAGWDA